VGIIQPQEGDLQHQDRTDQDTEERDAHRPHAR
jgi:hypothetical protein